MNILITLGLAMLLLLIGILVGHGLNGRARISRDKRQARIQFDLNRREHRLQTMLLDLRHRTGRSSHDSVPRGGFD